MLQRHSITSGMFKKKVKFKLNKLSGTLPAGLNIVRGANLTLGSNDFDATGTVTATGPSVIPSFWSRPGAWTPSAPGW
jgi:hypothetical protein